MYVHELPNDGFRNQTHVAVIDERRRHGRGVRFVIQLGTTEVETGAFLADELFGPMRVELEGADYEDLLTRAETAGRPYGEYLTGDVCRWLDSFGWRERVVAR